MPYAKKNYSYTDAAGVHFPDADKGDQVYYALDLTCLVDLESEVISSVTWILPDGITELHSAIVEGKEAQIKLDTPKAGVFCIKAVIESSDQGNVSKNTHRIILKVL